MLRHKLGIEYTLDAMYDSVYYTHRSYPINTGDIKMSGREILSDAYLESVIRKRGERRSGDIHTGGFITCPLSQLPGWPVHMIAVFYRNRLLAHCDDCGFNFGLYGKYWSHKPWKEWVAQGGKIESKPPPPPYSLNVDEAKLWLSVMPHLKTQLFPGFKRN